MTLTRVSNAGLGTQFSSLAHMIADANTYSVGTVLNTEKEGFAYECVASGGDLTLDSGQQVEVLPGASGAVDVDAFAPPKTSGQDDASAIHTAIDRLTALGGGKLTFSSSDYYLSTGVTVGTSRDVPLIIDLGGSTIHVEAAVDAFTLSQGQSGPEGCSVFNGVIDGGYTAGSGGVTIDDHSEARVWGTRIKGCETGVKITGSSNFSESSNLDHLVIFDCKTSIHLDAGGGTGSFGYAKWGLIHIAGQGATWDNSIGLHVGANTNFWNSDVSMLIFHVRASTTATAIKVEGDLSRNVRFHSVLEGFDTAVGRVAIELTSTANVFGCVFDTFFLGSWDTQVQDNTVGTNGDFVINERGTQYRAADDVSLLRALNLGDSFPKVEITPTAVSLGDGTANPDVSLIRSADGNLSADGLFEFKNSSNRRTILDSVATGTRTVTFGNSSGRVPSVGTGGSTSQTFGFNFMSAGAGAPTGTPADVPSGCVVFYYDTTNDKIYVYNGSWKATSALT